ncbi:MAG: adenylate/guanylate cyclase domain-containing protein [Planctomycetota bacterium]|jgi:adenylate cyclase
MNEDVKRDPKIEEVWRSYLTTGKPPKGVNLPWYESRSLRAVARRLPTDPRCKVCYYPFGGLGGMLVRSFFRLEPSKMNPHLCNICERFANENPGGAELEVALLFADIRDSTPLAASMNAYEFGQVINRFYRVTTNIIFEHGGMVEKLVGDAVTAFFVPAFAENQNFSRAAVMAGQAILAATGHDKAGGPWIPVGVGIHSGEAYVGAVGEPGKNTDIAVLGDNVNIAARFAGQAEAGEIVFSDDTRRMAGLDKVGLEFRSLTLKGKEDPIDAWISRSSAA